GREVADLDLAEGAGGLPGGEPERPAGVDLDPRVDVAPLGAGGEGRLVVDPAADGAIRDVEAEAVPGLVLVVDERGRLVLGGVGAAEAGEAGDGVGPSA